MKLSTAMAKANSTRKRFFLPEIWP